MLLPKLIPILERIPHTAFVDVFGGGGCVTMRKQPVKIEVVNDKNQELINFFLVLRDQPDELKKRLGLTPYSRALHEAERNTWQSQLSHDPVARAISYFIRTQYSFGAAEDGAFGVSLTASQPGRISRKVDTFFEAARRLRRAYIECLDWSSLIPKYDRPYTLFYCDPPYPGTDQKYQHRFNSKAMKKLILALEDAQARAVVSCVNAEKWFDESRWDIVRISRTVSGGGGNGFTHRSTRIECVCIKK